MRAGAVPGSGQVPDPRRFAYLEACADVSDAALTFAVASAARTGACAWHGCERRRAEAPDRDARPSTSPTAASAARWRCPPGPATRTWPACGSALDTRAPRRARNRPPGGGAAQLTRVNRLFGLDADYSPMPRPHHLVGRAAARGRWPARRSPDHPAGRSPSPTLRPSRTRPRGPRPLVAQDAPVAEARGRHQPRSRPGRRDGRAVAPGHLGVVPIVEDEQRAGLAAREDGDVELVPVRAQPALRPRRAWLPSRAGARRGARRNCSAQSRGPPVGPMKTARSTARPSVSARTAAAAPRECAITAWAVPSLSASARSASAKCRIECAGPRRRRGRGRRRSPRGSRPPAAAARTRPAVRRLPPSRGRGRRPARRPTTSRHAAPADAVTSNGRPAARKVSFRRLPPAARREEQVERPGGGEAGGDAPQHGERRPERPASSCAFPSMRRASRRARVRVRRRRPWTAAGAARGGAASMIPYSSCANCSGSRSGGSGPPPFRSAPRSRSRPASPSANARAARAPGRAGRPARWRRPRTCSRPGRWPSATPASARRAPHPRLAPRGWPAPGGPPISTKRAIAVLEDLELQRLLGLEVGEEAALRQVELVGQPADGEALEAHPAGQRRPPAPGWPGGSARPCGGGGSHGRRK